MATVKGDVHDIGKNIVGVVLGCNDYEVIDLGVMVPCETVHKTAREHDVDMIGLSGLITPSLDEMVHVAREMEREGFEVPLLIGGATTSPKHTAVKIAPGYHGPVVHVADRRAGCVGVVDRLNRDARDCAARGSTLENRAAQQGDRATNFGLRRRRRKLVAYPEAFARRFSIDWSASPLARPSFVGTRTLSDLPLDALVPFIDWSPFFQTWELKGKYPRIFEDPTVGNRGEENCTTTPATCSTGSSTRNGSRPGPSTGSFPPTPMATMSSSTRTSRAAGNAPGCRCSASSGSARARLHSAAAPADYVASVGSGLADYLGGFGPAQASEP